MTRLWILRAVRVSAGLAVASLLSLTALAPAGAASQDADTPAALVPSRPHIDEDSPEALAFAEDSLAQDWKLRAAVFFGSSAAVFAAGLWLGQKSDRPDWVRGYVGPLRDAPYVANQAAEDDPPPRGNAIL